MTNTFIKLYSISEEPESSFLLNEGTVYFYASDNDKYAIKGKNLVIGATEIIMTHLLDTGTKRIETAITDRESTIKKLSIEKFLAGMDSYSFAINVSMVIAKQVMLTNGIINKNLNQLTGEVNKNRELSIRYFVVMDRLKAEYNKRKLPWLNEFIKKFETSLVYKRGEAFYRSSEPTKISATTNLSDKMVEYPINTVICEEDTRGEEMFILQSGAIDVKIKGNRVATIDDSGTIFGEMALLLNEPRTATLTAKNSVVVTKITRENLKEIAEKQADFLKELTVSLAKKHYYNIIKIESTNHTLIEKAMEIELGGEKKSPGSHKTEIELSGMISSLEDLNRQKNTDYIKEILGDGKS